MFKMGILFLDFQDSFLLQYQKLNNLKFIISLNKGEI